MSGNDIGGSCVPRLRAKLRDGSRAGKRIARVILDSLAHARDMSIEALARRCGTNASTVTRFCKGMGYRGYKDFQFDLAVAAARPEPVHLEDLFGAAAPATVVRAVFECNRRSLAETEMLLDVGAAVRVARVIRRSRRVIFLGIGESGRSASHAAERMMSLGLAALAVTDPYDQIFATATVRRGDVVVGISHTGETAHVLEALRVARSRGAGTVCITNYPDSPVAEASEFRLITSFREHRVSAAVSSSHMAQLGIIDTLYFLVASFLGTGARALADSAEERVQSMLRTKRRSSRPQSKED